jgi:hydroxyatrazine ethylaminohydrolase
MTRWARLSGTCGIGMPTDLTMVNGRISWAKGEFPGLDEAEMAAEAEAALASLNA